MRGGFLFLIGDFRLYIRYMEVFMTYDNFISQFEILDNPSKKKGFHRHHIVPQSEQTIKDDRCVYLLPSQHLWAHILYDREHGTRTATRLKNSSHINNPACYEDCIPFDETITGFSGHHHSDETKQIISEKVSEAQKGHNVSEEAREKIRQFHLGKSLPEETKQKLSNTLKGRKFSEEHKKKISEATKGRVLSEETKKKISDAKKGKESHPGVKNHPNMSKKVIQLSKDGEFIKEFPSMKEAEREIGLDARHISDCCRGKQKTAGKSIWRYAS